MERISKENRKTSDDANRSLFGLTELDVNVDNDLQRTPYIPRAQPLSEIRLRFNKRYLQKRSELIFNALFVYGKLSINFVRKVKFYSLQSLEDLS